MRAVLDTNVALSALLFGGVPQRLIDLARTDRLTLYTSAPLLDELADVLHRAKFARRFARNRPVTPGFVLRRYTLLATRVELAPGPIERTVPTDADDDVVIATALTAGAELIVSGDADLLVLHPFRGMPILAPVDVVRSVRKSSLD